MWVVKICKQNVYWNKAKVVFQSDDELDCRLWLVENMKIGYHYYIEQERSK